MSAFFLSRRRELFFSTYAKQVTITCDYSFRGSYDLFWPPKTLVCTCVYTHTHTHTHTHTSNANKIFKRFLTNNKKITQWINKQETFMEIPKRYLNG